MFKFYVGYNDLLKANEEHIPHTKNNNEGDDDEEASDSEDEENDKYKTVVMLNCGGNIDIITYFNHPDVDVTFYVFDSHRPVHLSNIFADDQVLIFDEEGRNDNIPSREIVYGEMAGESDGKTI